MTQCAHSGCALTAMLGVPHCRNHLTDEDKAKMPAWNGARPQRIEPFSSRSSLSHDTGAIKKTEGVAKVKRAYLEFVATMRDVAEEIILKKGWAWNDDLHIWCERNGRQIPVNEKGQKTAMTAVFKDRKRFEAVRDSAGELVCRQSKLTTNNARRLCIYKMNPNYRRPV